MTMTERENDIEFSRKIEARKLALSAQSLKLVANSCECAKLAQRFGLVELQEFSGVVRVRKTEKPGVFEASGNLTAKLVQQCVVTLDPIVSVIDGDFCLLLVKSSDNPKVLPLRELNIDPNEQEWEPLDEEVIDFGEILAQYLSLDIVPFPRREDADVTEIMSLDGMVTFNEPVRERKNPFSILRES